MLHFDDGFSRSTPSNLFSTSPPNGHPRTITVAAADPSPAAPPKSKRQLKKELKAAQWAAALAEKRKDPAFIAAKPAEKRRDAPKIKDEEVDFLSRKRRREMEREAVGSGAGEKKRKRKVEEFPLLSGELAPKVLVPSKGNKGRNEERNGERVHDGQLKAKAERLRCQREQLPIWRHRDALKECLRDRDVLVMLGQTGSGKSTQIGQFLVDEPWMKHRGGRGGCIAITQPRRIAATGLARRVAAEMGTRLGEEVGYSVRFDNKASSRTRIKFLTDGMLLQEMLADPLLRKYSAVVVDEAHERTVGTDLVMGFLRRLVYGERKGTLKVVVMSATLSVEAMARFFEENYGEGLAPLIKEEPQDIEGIFPPIDQTEEQIPNNELTTNKRKKKKKKLRNGFIDPEDLIRTPSPPLEPVRLPATMDSNEGAVVETESGAGVIPYFGSVALFEVPGRQFPVEIHHTAEPVPDYVEAALKTVFQIHVGEPLGDVLVFLTGQDEIVSLQKSIEDYAEDMAKTMTEKVPKIMVLPLYAALPLHVQSRVFDPTPPNTRKIVLATNIAETSLTVSGVKFVIDCGKAKIKQYRPKLGLESLLITSISKSSALQRTGRAGRESPGKCYRLYTEDDFNAFVESSKPEILRTDVSNAILILKARGQNDVINFDYLDPPKPSSMRKALEQLYALGALNSSGEITKLGHQMAKLPLSPTLARVLLAAAEPELNCVSEVVDVIAALSTENLFSTPRNDDEIEAFEEARKTFRRSEGDHIMLLEIVRAFESAMAEGSMEKKIWCERHSISTRGINQMLDIRKQLRQYCGSLPGVGEDTWVTAAGDNVSPEIAERVLKAFLRGYFQQTARAAPNNSYVTVLGHQSVTIHPASILFGARREAIMYHEYVFTTKPFARWCSAVQMDWIADASPAYLKGNV